jgi:hypothetical protein
MDMGTVTLWYGNMAQPGITKESVVLWHGGAGKAVEEL